MGFLEDLEKQSLAKAKIDNENKAIVAVARKYQSGMRASSAKFVQAIIEHYERTGYLSDKQRAALAKTFVWEKITWKDGI